MALSRANEVYFWGSHHSSEGPVEVPIKLAIADVTDIGTLRGSSISGLLTSEGKVYFWGFAFGHLFPAPVVTGFNSIAQLFASFYDPPMMFEQMIKLPSLMEELRRGLDDIVSRLPAVS